MKKANFIKRATLVKQLMFFAVTALTFQSCIKDNFDTKKIAAIKYNPNFAVPLVYSSLSMADILNLKNANDLIQTGSDGSLTLVYTDNIISQDASSITAFNIPNQAPPTFTISTAPIAGTVSNGDSVSTPLCTQTIAAKDSSQLSSVLLKGGTMGFSFSSGIKSNVDVVISIPGATKNGVAFSQTVRLNYTGATPVTASPSFDLTGYNFDLTQGGASYNQFKVNYTIKAYGPVIITGAEQFNVDATMKTLVYSKIAGNIGQQNIIMKTDTIAVTIFNHSIGAASFQLLDPKVKLITYNSFGVPINAQLTQLSGDNLKGTSNLLLTPTFPIAIAFPNSSQAGQTLMASDSLTTTTSNIVSVFNQTPKNIIYTFSAQTTTVSASQTDFVLDTSKFRLDLEVELPLNGTAFNFAMLDTVAFSIGSTVTDNLSSGLLRISNTNGFPIDVNMQIYFVDSLFNKLDSLLTSEQPLIASGSINSAGQVTTPTITNKDITIDPSRLKKLGNTKQLLIYAKASTINSGATPVKIYSNYRLEVKLGLQIQVDAKFKP